MNATLARPYQQPFWSLSDVNRDNLAIFNEMTEEGHLGHGKALYMKFLLDSDAYEFENRKKQERLFSDFAEWFHEDCVRSYNRALDRESSTGGDYMPYVVDCHHPKTLHFIGGGEELPRQKCLGCHVLRKLQQLLIMFGWLAGYHLCQVAIALYDFPKDYEDDIESEVVPQQHWTGHTEMLTIVPVGSYKLYNMSIPKDFVAAAKAEYPPRLSNLPDDSLPDLEYICQWAHNYSGQVNYRRRPRGGEVNTIQPPLLIFEYMFRKFFKRRFSGIFNVDRYSLEWSIFFEAGARFFGSSEMDQPYGSETLLIADTVDDGGQMYFYDRG